MTERTVGLYTASHDACGEPSCMTCTEEEAETLMTGGYGTPLGRFSKWDFRTDWIKTTPELARTLYANAQEAYDKRMEEYEAAQAVKRGDMTECIYDGYYQPWLGRNAYCTGILGIDAIVGYQEDTPEARTAFNDAVVAGTIRGMVKYR